MRYVNGRVEIYSRVHTHTHTHTPTHTTHTCGRAGLAAWLKRGFHFLVKICQKKTITSHSWRHLRPQFFFFLSQESSLRYIQVKNPGAFECRTPATTKTVEQTKDWKYSSLWCDGFGRAQRPVLFIVHGEGSEKERRGCWACAIAASCGFTHNNIACTGLWVSIDLRGYFFFPQI